MMKKVESWKNCLINGEESRIMKELFNQWWGKSLTDSWIEIVGLDEALVMLINTLRLQ